MYICNECEKEFEDPERCIGDTTEFWGAPYTEMYNGCPYCKSRDYRDESDEEESDEAC